MVRGFFHSDRAPHSSRCGVWLDSPSQPARLDTGFEIRALAVCSASDRQGSNFESCVWRTVSSQSSHHPQEVLLAQFSLYVHKGGLKPDSFHFSQPHELTSIEYLYYGSTAIMNAYQFSSVRGSILDVKIWRPQMSDCDAERVRAERLNPYSAGIDFSRILTTKVDPRTVRVKIFIIAVDP